MDIAVTVVQVLLGLAFLMAGGMKLAQSRDKVIASGGKWAEDFSPTSIKIIGLGEFACALGITIPHFLGMGGYFTSAAAGGVAIFMAGAFYTHLRRKESPFLVVTSVLFLMAAFYAIVPFFFF
jgi:hypothetical protein